MNKRYLFLVFLFALIPSALFAGYYYARGGAAATDYTAYASCMGAWLMTNNGGNESDVSGEGGTLTQSGSIPTSSTVPSGYSGTSRDFESGDSDFLTHADNLSTDISGADQPITLTAWIKLESTGSESIIIAKGAYTGTDRQYSLYVDSSNIIRCNIATTDSTSSAAIGATAMSTDWAHVACVYNDTDIRIYVNGSLDSNGTDNPKSYTGGIYSGDGVFRVGSMGGSRFFDGLIDEPGVWDVALSSTDISSIYTNGIDGSKGGND